MPVTQPATGSSGTSSTGRTPRFIESVKRAVVLGLREVFDSEHPDPEVRGIRIDMEYPQTKAEYPAIWVQFSLRRLGASGLGNPIFVDDQDRPYSLWSFDGTVSLTVVALTSRERDRISDAIIQTFAFGQMTGPTSEFLEHVREDPNVSFMVNQDELTGLGQSVTAGVPWNEDLYGYEDGYSFDITGQFRSAFTTDPVERLSEIDVYPGVRLHPEDPPQYDNLPGDWI